MEPISYTLGKNVTVTRTKAPPKHELAAAVNLIDEAGLMTKKYGYTYWLGKVSRAMVSDAEMHGILKDIANMPTQYSKGGRLTNVLTTLAKQRKKQYDEYRRVQKANKRPSGGNRKKPDTKRGKGRAPRAV